MKSEFEHDPLTEKIIGCCFDVHRELGPGFNEKIYSASLQILLAKENISFIAEKEFVVMFQGKQAVKSNDNRCNHIINRCNPHS